MTKLQIKRFIKLHWIKIVLIALGIVFLSFFIFILIVGLRNFFSLESFYKKMTLASVPLQLFIVTISTFTFMLYAVAG